MQTANEKVIENFGFETLNVHGTPDNQTDVLNDYIPQHSKFKYSKIGAATMKLTELDDGTS